MNTLRLDPHYHPLLRFPAAIALLTAAILTALTVTIYVPHRVESLTGAGTEPAGLIAAHALPFTPGDVEAYFVREIGTTPERFGNTTIIPQPGTLNDAEDYEVAVTALAHGGLAVAFRGSGLKAMQIAESFCSSSLFQSREAAGLTALISRRYDWPSATLPRFTVHVRTLELIDLYQVSLEFTPLP